MHEHTRTKSSVIFLNNIFDKKHKIKYLLIQNDKNSIAPYTFCPNNDNISVWEGVSCQNFNESEILID